MKRPRKRKQRTPKLIYNAGCFRAANRILEKDYQGAFPIRYDKNRRAIVDAPLFADLIDEHTAASMLLTAAKAALYWLYVGDKMPKPPFSPIETCTLLAKAIAQADGTFKPKGRRQ